MAERAARHDVSVRPLVESDLPVADEIMRVAFGTFLGVPEPRTFMGDAAFVQPRWRSNPTAAFAAELDGTLIGSNFATRWGSFGFFGPLTVRPDLWDLGVGKRLLEPVMGCFELWRVTHAGLFTFAHSQKHVGLYQRFGFWPRFLTAIMAKPVSSVQHASPDWSGFSREAPEQLSCCAPVGISPMWSTTGWIFPKRSERLQPWVSARPRCCGLTVGWRGLPLATSVRAPKVAARAAISSSRLCDLVLRPPRTSRGY